MARSQYLFNPLSHKDVQYIAISRNIYEVSLQPHKSAHPQLLYCQSQETLSVLPWSELQW
jgi:hypothetical protein